MRKQYEKKMKKCLLRVALRRRPDRIGEGSDPVHAGESDEKLMFEPKTGPYMEPWSCFLSPFALLSPSLSH